MFKNYFMLNRLVTELNQELYGYNITRVFSYEKEKLILILIKGNEEISLEISVNPVFPYLILRRQVSVPKKNFIDFFVSHLPLNNVSFEIANDDRIIIIKSDKVFIYFTIRGKFTNIYLIKDNTSIESFKKVDENVLNMFLKEMPDHKFIAEFNNLKIEDGFINPDEIRKMHPIIGKEIINEAIRREGNQEKISGNILKGIINEIKQNDPALFIDEETGDVNLGIGSFGIFPFSKKEKYQKLTQAFNYFLVEKFSRESISDKKKIVEKFLERELSKIAGKLNNVSVQIQRGTKEEVYNRKANLLLVNLNKLTKGREAIELPDLYNDNVSSTIKLDPKLSPKQNVDSYFDKARNERIKLEKSRKLFSDLDEKYTKLKTIKEKYLSAKSANDFNSIIKELKIKQEINKKPEDDIKNKFRHYIIKDKYNVYVGKDSKSNDLLTMKFAKQNDYWFHARGASGSHVILKNENPKEGIPKNILKLAASLAAYHSKAKTSGMAPVSYTQKKYVTKKKGMEPGKVVLLKEEVLIVKPEIPVISKYESES